MVPVLVALKVGTWPATGLLFTSISVMVTVDVAIPLATMELVPLMRELAATAAPAVKVTLPSVFTTGVAIARALISALVEASVQVEIPEVSETEQLP